MPFSSQREAKQFLIDKIAAEAELQGIPLLDSEKKILAFAEQDRGTTVGVTDEMLAEADEEWESGIARIFADAYKRASPEEQELYKQAKKKLEEGDHYLLVMVDEGFRRA
jgi:hypothetical protein